MNNYHTHTYRCTHAIGTEKDMVLRAIQEGYKTLGFSEHVPLPKLRFHLIKALPFSITGIHTTLGWVKAFLLNGPGMRMPFSEKKKHLFQIDKLIEEYRNQIKILKGFECEYLEEYLPYYKSLLETKEVDYLILGHHFRDYAVARRYYGRPNLTLQEVECYISDAKKALKTGLFSYFAHPDLFFRGYQQWDEYLEQLVTELCECAKANNVLLEINAGGIRSKKISINNFTCYPFPNPFFWRIASQVGCKCIIGMDAHQPSHLNKEDYQRLVQFANEMNLDLVETLE